MGVSGVGVEGGVGVVGGVDGVGAVGVAGGISVGDGDGAAVVLPIGAVGVTGVVVGVVGVVGIVGVPIGAVALGGRELSDTAGSVALAVDAGIPVLDAGIDAGIAVNVVVGAGAPGVTVPAQEGMELNSNMSTPSRLKKLLLRFLQAFRSLVIDLGPRPDVLDTRLRLA